MAGWPQTRGRTADEQLIRQLYQEHGGALLAYATRLTGDRAAAEDIFQETLIRAWRNPDALSNDKGSVRSYLFTITKNLVIDRHRARRARPAEVAESPGSAPVEQDHSDQVVDSMVVLAAMDRLSEEHRVVIDSIYIRGRNVEETAETLGVPPGTVKSRTYYALRRLRDSIGEASPPIPDSVTARGAAG